jgi:ubiquinone/menaquinone biosynthesis C-methylase UbiE
MSVDFGSGFHVAPGHAVDAAAYDSWTGRWSRLFVPPVLAAAEIGHGQRVLDVSTGTGEAAQMALSITGASGCVIGADISSAMLAAARARLGEPSFLPVAADGQALPFRNASFDAVVCQLGLQFFPDPALGLVEFRRVLRRGGCAAVCVISTPDRAPMWGILANAIAHLRPNLRNILYLSFALHDPRRLEELFSSAGFKDVEVVQEARGDTIESFDDYWAPIERGIGSIPQAYLSLSDEERRSVREQVKSRLSSFETDGKLVLAVEMLIGKGRA